MADTKISALPASTLPLAGTEVLPIVQSGTTKKVATDDLTVKNVRSNATNGILQIAGPAAAATRVMTTPDANFTAARTDAAQSFTGNQTLSTGNLIIGTSGQGIDFSATPGTGTSELLADYEEGTWTPTFIGTTTAGAPTYAAQKGLYTKIGRTVNVTAFIQISNKGGMAGNLQIGGLPFTSISTSSMYGSYSIGEHGGMTFAASRTYLTLESTINNTTIVVYESGSGVDSVQHTIANTADASYIILSGFYFAA
jgi:hypothetical protein